MELRFEPVKSGEEIKEITAIADIIWHEYWPSLLSDDQVDYMVEKFQSLAAFTADIHENGNEYWILKADGKVVGYTGGREEHESSRFFISKIYLFAEERGQGYASQVIAFYQNLCRERGLGAMYLTVNKYNELGIRAYEGKGFDTIDSVVTDIGEGYVMDDYIMEKKIG